MLDRPDYAALTRGQIAILDRINSGEAGLPALQQVVRLADEVLGGFGAGFAEYAPGHGRVVAATGGCERAIGRRVEREDGRLRSHRTVLLPLDPADEIEGGTAREASSSGDASARSSDDAESPPRGRGAGDGEFSVRGRDSGDGGGSDVGRSSGGELGSSDGESPARGRSSGDGDGGGSGDGESPARGRSSGDGGGSDVGRSSGGNPGSGDGNVVLGERDVSDEGGSPGGGPVRLTARCEVGESIVGSLYVLFDGEPGPEQRAVLELLSSYVGRLYALHSGLPVYADAREAAERTHRQENRDLWVAVTSHELRTPVTVIKGYADTLTNHWETLGDSGRKEAVRIIGARAGELARLVDRLLSATSDEGELGAAPAGPFDLVETLRNAIDELPADLRERLTLKGLPGDLPKAYGERDSIATILTELATNAEKYSPPGTEVEVCAGVDGETLRFRVCDRGTGIRPEHVERAFERYWQAETGDGPPHPGAGLGLYLVRRLVERQQGWVSLRPREGGGTTAEVRLPRA